jgi:hypothetical protein
VISSGSEPGALRKENAALKAELANMQRRLDTADKVIQLRGKQDQQLRDSIYQARREVNFHHFSFGCLFFSELYFRLKERWVPRD